ncbi:NmrA family NAD(P)-binding protein [Mesorhizobium sp. LHD-90]|uniref:NmrA family NAD(P)-binding protein n=1 Tax=Mesorhizobium sp. LHD-90 TaxID=3071414 RepID=UPI0027E20707|nr:NmrA family NAD(P)-binding protein [Mesorhizobium sp. LHD-90]MDQ6433566.1 NmrA family NAD(P)-binding protein [Mesorhizobium sp. LHD-90]
MTDTIFITGASGHLGRAVIHHLLERGVAPSKIIAGTRDPDKIADLAARGVVVRAADFDDKPGLVKAFAGAHTILIVSTDALDGAGTRQRQHSTAVEAAVEAGAKRLAYTSLPVPETSKVSFAPDHLNTEKAVKATGLPYLLFRDNWYQENLFRALPHAFAGGQWYTSAGAGRTAYVARDDIAAAIAGAIVNWPTQSTTYTLTGTEALTNEQIAKLASAAVGKPLQVVDLTDEQLAGGMKAAGLPEAIIPTLVSFDTATRAGDLALVTGDVEALSGRKSKPLKVFLEENKAVLGA